MCEGDKGCSLDPELRQPLRQEEVPQPAQTSASTTRTILYTVPAKFDPDNHGIHFIGARNC